VAASAAQQVAPAAGPAAPGLQQAALPDAVAPTSSSDPPQPCPRSLSINRDVPTPFTCICGNQGTRRGGSVWGTDVYTERSDLCSAALHAGVITAEGGPVTVMRSEGRPIYAGSSRNGIRTNDHSSSDASITFAGMTIPSTGPCPIRLSINPDLPTPFTCVCGHQAARSSGGGYVWGTDFYTDRSDLCRAALHAGVITVEGGSITVTRSEGLPIYGGSSRNGVTTKDYGRSNASIRIE
jgi:hypothetical protein